MNAASTFAMLRLLLPTVLTSLSLGLEQGEQFETPYKGFTFVPYNGQSKTKFASPSSTYSRVHSDQGYGSLNGFNNAGSAVPHNSVKRPVDNKIDHSVAVAGSGQYPAVKKLAPYGQNTGYRTTASYGKAAVYATPTPAGSYGTNQHPNIQKTSQPQLPYSLYYPAYQGSYGTGGTKAGGYGTKNAQSYGNKKQDYGDRLPYSQPDTQSYGAKKQDYGGPASTHGYTTAAAYGGKPTGTNSYAGKLHPIPKGYGQKTQYGSPGTGAAYGANAYNTANYGQTEYGASNNHQAQDYERKSSRSDTFYHTDYDSAGYQTVSGYDVVNYPDSDDSYSIKDSQQYGHEAGISSSYGNEHTNSKTYNSGSGYGSSSAIFSEYPGTTSYIPPKTGAYGSQNGYGSHGYGKGSYQGSHGAGTGSYGSPTTYASSTKVGCCGYGPDPIANYPPISNGYLPPPSVTGHGFNVPAYGATNTGYGYGSTGYGTSSTGHGAGSAGYGTGNTGYGTGNTGYGTGNTGYGTTGNTGYGTGNTGYGTTGNTGYGTGNTGYGTGNTGYGTTGNTGYGTGNTGYGTGNTGYGTGNTGYGTANTGYGTGNTGHDAGIAGYGTGNAGYGTGNTGHGVVSGFGKTGWQHQGYEAQQGTGRVLTNTGYGCHAGCGFPTTGHKSGYKKQK